jgi:hypothetical protein
MHLKRTATIAIGGAAFAAWLAGAATSVRRDDDVQERPHATGADVAEVALAGEIARLHDRLTPVASPRDPGRDLFRFVGPKPHAVASAAPARAAVTEAPTLLPAAARQPIKLVGIAEDVRGDTVVRTAILSTQSQLFLVKEGEAVSARFKVSRIAADVVELIDLSDNSTLRLPLK